MTNEQEDQRLREEKEVHEEGKPQEQESASYVHVHEALRQRAVDMAVTNTAVPDVRYAGFWLRLLAIIIDTLVLFVVVLLFELLIPLDQIGHFFLNLAINLIYTITMTYVWGQTLGKMACGIVVVPLEGGPRSFLFIVLRETVLKFISTIIFMIGYIIAAFHPKKQGLHDILAKTVVVYRS